MWVKLIKFMVQDSEGTRHHEMRKQLFMRLFRIRSSQENLQSDDDIALTLGGSNCESEWRQKPW